MKPRVLFVANARLPTEKAHGHAIVKMCEAYARIGLDVDLWYPRRNQPTSRLRDTTLFDYYGVPEVFRARALPNVDIVRAERWVPKRLFRYLVRAHDLLWAWSVARRAARERFEIHHTRNAAVAFCLTRAGLHTVLEVHNPPAGQRTKLIRRLGPRRQLRGVIALTEACRERLVTLGIPDSKIIVLGSCVDLDAYADLPSPTECRSTIGLPDDRQVVGYVGRFQMFGFEKGLPEVMGALGILRREHGLHPVFLGVGGPMDPVPGYMQLASEAGVPVDDLHFADHVPSSEVPIWIRACDVGVIPLRSDPDHIARFASPLKAFEFQAAGVPTVATDVPALREALTDGDTALMVEPDDPAALARGLARLLTDDALRTSLANRGRLAVEAHTWVRRAQHIWGRFGVDRPLKVVFIVGSGHCGSTLLDLLLDGHSRIAGVGEINGAQPDLLCSCGRPAGECSFWRTALGPEPWPRRRLNRPRFAFASGRGEYYVPGTDEIVDTDAYIKEVEETYGRIRDLTGADIIVDSSKSPERLEVLSRSDAIEPIVLHLVRDGRAVTWSYERKYRSSAAYFTKWARKNAKVEVLRARLRGREPFLFLRYEDLVADPERNLRRVCDAIGVEYEPGMLAFRDAEHHQIGGNRMRLGTDTTIRRDDAWRTEMPRSRRLLFGACFGVLNTYYARRRSL